MDAHVAMGCLQAVMSLVHPELVAFVQRLRDAQPALTADARYKKLRYGGLGTQLKFLRDHWDTHCLPRALPRRLLEVVRDALARRNQVAHQQKMTLTSVQRALATFETLLELIEASAATRQQVRALVTALVADTQEQATERQRKADKGKQYQKQQSEQEQKRMRKQNDTSKGNQYATAPAECAKDCVARRDFGNAVYWATRAIDAIRGDGDEEKRVDTAELVAMLALRGRSRLELRQYEHVRVDAEQVVALDARHVAGYWLLAESLAGLQRLEEARRICGKGLTVNPHDAALKTLQKRLNRREEGVISSGASQKVDREAGNEDEEEKEDDDEAAAIRSMRAEEEPSRDVDEAELKNSDRHRDDEQEGQEDDEEMAVPAPSTTIPDEIGEEGERELEQLSFRECSQLAVQCAARGELPRAIAWCTRALSRIDPECDPHPAKPLAASMHLRRAECFLATRCFRDAVRDTDRALQLRENRYAKASAVKALALFQWSQVGAKDDVDDDEEEVASRAEQAIEIYTKALELSPQAPDLLALQTTFSSGIQSLSIVQTPCDSDNTSHSSDFNRAMDMMSRRDYGNAIHWFDRAMSALASNGSSQCTKMTMLHVHRAQCRIELGQFAQVVTDAQQALLLDATCADAYHALGIAYCRLERIDKARTACADGLRVAPHHTGLQALSKNLAKMSPVSAKAVLPIHRPRPAIDDARSGAGTSDGSPANAAASSDCMTRAECTDCAARCMERGDLAAAITWSSQAIALFQPDTEPIQLIASLYLRRAGWYLVGEQYDNALRDVDRALSARNGHYAKAHSVKCEVLLALARPSDAVEVWKYAIVRSPQAPDLLAMEKRLHNLGLLQAPKSTEKSPVVSVTSAGSGHGVIAQGMQPITNSRDDRCQSEPENPVYAVIRTLKQAIKRSPGDASLYRAIVRCRLQVKQYPLALRAAETAVSLSPNEGDGYACLCEVLTHLQAWSDAKKACDRGLVRTPHHIGLLLWRDRLIGTADPHTMAGANAFQSRDTSTKLERSPNGVDNNAAAVEEADALIRRRDFGHAIALLNRAIEALEGGSGSRDTTELGVMKARLYRRRSGCHFELQQYEHARRDAEVLIEQDARSVEGYRLLSASFHGLQLEDHAFAACRRGLQIVRDDGELLALERVIYAQQRVNEGGERKALVANGVQRMNDQQYATAIVWFSKAISDAENDAGSTTEPGNPDREADASPSAHHRAVTLPSYYVRRAECFMALDEFASALSDAEHAVRIRDGRYAKAHRLQCLALIALGRGDEAKSVSRRLVQASPHVVQLVELQQEVIKLIGVQRRIQYAPAPHAQGLTIQLTTSEAKTGQANASSCEAPKKERKRLVMEAVQAMGKQQYARAETYLSRAIQLLQPTMVAPPKRGLQNKPTALASSSQKKAKLYAHRARCRLALDSYELALQDAQQSRAQARDYVEAYRLECDALMGLKRWQLAMQACQQGLWVSPTDAPLLARQVELVKILAEARGRSHFHGVDQPADLNRVSPLRASGSTTTTPTVESGKDSCVGSAKKVTVHEYARAGSMVAQRYLVAMTLLGGVPPALGFRVNSDSKKESRASSSG